MNKSKKIFLSIITILIAFISVSCFTLLNAAGYSYGGVTYTEIDGYQEIVGGSLISTTEARTNNCEIKISPASIQVTSITDSTKEAYVYCSYYTESSSGLYGFNAQYMSNHHVAVYANNTLLKDFTGSYGADNFTITLSNYTTYFFRFYVVAKNNSIIMPTLAAVTSSDDVVTPSFSGEWVQKDVLSNALIGTLSGASISAGINTADTTSITSYSYDYFADKSSGGYTTRALYNCYVEGVLNFARMRPFKTSDSSFYNSNIYKFDWDESTDYLHANDSLTFAFSKSYSSSYDKPLTVGFYDDDSGETYTMSFNSYEIIHYINNTANVYDGRYFTLNFLDLYNYKSATDLVASDTLYLDFFTVACDSKQNCYFSGLYSNAADYTRGYTVGYDDGVESQQNVIDILTDDNSDLKESLENLTYQYKTIKEALDAYMNDDMNFATLCWTIASTPFEAFKQIWNVELLGVNLGSIMTGILFAGLILFVWKKFI